MNIKLENLILAALLCGSIVQAASNGPTKAEFRRDIIFHRGRVQLHASKFIGNFPDHFPNLYQLDTEARQRFISAYLQVHDAPKIMSLEQLKSLGYQAEVTLFDRLYGQWGKDFKKRPNFIVELNAVEAIYKEIILRRHFSDLEPTFLEKIKKEVAYAEFIADETDTKIHRGPELGIETKPFDAEARLRDMYRDLKGAEMSRWLEIQLYRRSGLIFCETHFRLAK